jgi:hypothetical protein
VKSCRTHVDKEAQKQGTTQTVMLPSMLTEQTQMRTWMQATWTQKLARDSQRSVFVSKKAKLHLMNRSLYHVRHKYAIHTA